MEMELSERIMKEFYACPKCGSAICGEKKRYFVCPECGSALCEEKKLEEFNDNYCGNCGTKLTSAREKALALVGFQFAAPLADVQYDNIFSVLPDDEEKTITISPSTFGSVLKLDVKKAEVLAKIIQDQIQEWK